VDVGAESTRPGATQLSHEEEWERLKCFDEHAINFCHSHGMQVSVDTRHALTAEKMLQMSVDWINDVGGMEQEAMRACVGAAQCVVVLMHSLSVPADPAQTLPENVDVIKEIITFFETRMQWLEQAGVKRARIVLDPGIGFGKTPEQSMRILQRIEEIKALGMPVLVGHSRKSFLKRFTDREAADRDDATLAISASLLQKNIDYLRVHNTARHNELLKAHWALST
jgi:dihydropteroate synthase